MDLQITLTKIKYLIERGFKIGLYCVESDSNRRAIEFFRKTINNMSGCYFETKPLLDNTIKETNTQSKEVLCRTRELLLAPDGTVYRCHRDLYKHGASIGNIADMQEISSDFRPCNNYLECHPCDVKVKRDRFGNDGYCAIEKREN
jgi:hypothetical protein